MDVADGEEEPPSAMMMALFDAVVGEAPSTPSPSRPDTPPLLPFLGLPAPSLPNGLQQASNEEENEVDILPRKHPRKKNTARPGQKAGPRAATTATAASKRKRKPSKPKPPPIKRYTAAEANVTRNTAPVPVSDESGSDVWLDENDPDLPPAPPRSPRLSSFKHISLLETCLGDPATAPAFKLKVRLRKAAIGWLSTKEAFLNRHVGEQAPASVDAAAAAVAVAEAPPPPEKKQHKDGPVDLHAFARRRVAGVCSVARQAAREAVVAVLARAVQLKLRLQLRQPGFALTRLSSSVLGAVVDLEGVPVRVLELKDKLATVESVSGEPRPRELARDAVLSQVLGPAYVDPCGQEGGLADGASAAFLCADKVTRFCAALEEALMAAVVAQAPEQAADATKGLPSAYKTRVNHIYLAMQHANGFRLLSRCGLLDTPAALETASSSSNQKNHRKKNKKLSAQDAAQLSGRDLVAILLSSSNLMTTSITSLLGFTLAGPLGRAFQVALTQRDVAKMHAVDLDDAQVKLARQQAKQRKQARQKLSSSSSSRYNQQPEPQPQQHQQPQPQQQQREAGMMTKKNIQPVIQQQPQQPPTTTPTAAVEQQKKEEEREWPGLSRAAFASSSSSSSGSSWKKQRGQQPYRDFDRAEGDRRRHRTHRDEDEFANPYSFYSQKRQREEQPQPQQQQQQQHKARKLSSSSSSRHMRLPGPASHGPLPPSASHAPLRRVYPQQPPQQPQQEPPPPHSAVRRLPPQQQPPPPQQQQQQHRPYVHPDRMQMQRERGHMDNRSFPPRRERDREPPPRHHLPYDNNRRFPPPPPRFQPPPRPQHFSPPPSVVRVVPSPPQQPQAKRIFIHPDRATPQPRKY